MKIRYTMLAAASLLAVAAGGFAITSPASASGWPSGNVYFATSTNGSQVLNAAGCGNPAHVIQWAFTTSPCPGGWSPDEWYAGNTSGGTTSIWTYYGGNYMCMNVAGGYYHAGTQIYAWNCDNSNGGVQPNEKFQVNCNSNWCWIQPIANTSYCLNVAGGNAQGNNVILYPCNPTYTNEQFTIHSWP